MAVAFSQHATSFHPQGSAPANGTLTLPSVANGDTILLLTAVTGGFGGLSSISGCGATWTRLLSEVIPPNGSYATLELWKGVGVVAASGATISFSNASNVIIDALAMSFTGATQDVIAAVLAEAAADGNSTTHVLGSTGLPFEAGQAVATFLVYEKSANIASALWTATPVGGYTDSPSAWTTADEYVSDGNNSSANNISVDTAYKITTAAGTYSRQANLSGNVGENSWRAFTVLLSADPLPAPPPRGHVIQAAALSRAANW